MERRNVTHRDGEGWGADTPRLRVMILGFVALVLLGVGNMGAAGCMLAHAIHEANCVKGPELTSLDRVRTPPPALPAGTVSKAYDGRVKIVPASSPVKIEVMDNSLPGELRLDVQEGAVRVHGTPRVSGTYRFTLRVGEEGEEAPPRDCLVTYALRVTP